MKWLKGLWVAVVGVVLAPELRPAEVKIGRALGVAVLAYLGVHFGEQA